MDKSSLKLKHSSAVHALVYGLISKLVLYIKQIDNFEHLKLNPELTRSLIHKVDEIAAADKSLSAKQKKAINKTMIVLEAITQAFSLLKDEIPFIESQISFILDNKLIKESKLPKLLSSAGNCFKSIVKN